MAIWAFLFTDLEGSTRRWEDATEAMMVALQRHHELLQQAVTTHGGRVLSDMGDGIAAVFSSPREALHAAVEAQRSLTAESWPDVEPLRARMGVHVGEAFEHGDELRGPTLNRCARLMAAAHGGQVLCTMAMAELISDSLPHGVGLRDLGEHRLRDLVRPEHVFQVVGPGLPGDFPALRTGEAFRTNLPSQLSSFVGRDFELAEIGSLLDSHRLVTLVGPGGMGKTRLALRVAADRLHVFRDGAWVVDLTELSEADDVMAFIAVTFSVTADSERSLEQALLDFFRRQQMLVVLDNCEHVVGAAAAFVAGAQREAPELRMLATSREALGIAGERVIRLGPLATPGAGVSDEATASSQPAFQLFVDRARESRAGFAIDGPETVETIGEIARRLDGMPLAIELAAARVSSMTPREIAANLDERFRLLTSRRAEVDRHPTLRAVIDWSYDLLEPRHRETLDKLSVFAGSCRVDAVAAVSACDELEAIELLGVLVDKSVVVADSIGDATEYRLLETIRHYGSERLVELNLDHEVRFRHLGFYLELARQMDERVGFAGDERLRARLDRELGNVRAAAGWAIDVGHVDEAVRLVGRLCGLGLSPRVRNEVSTLAVRISTIEGFEALPGASAVLRTAVDELWARGDTAGMARLADRVGLVGVAGPRDRFEVALVRKRAVYVSGDWRVSGEASTEMLAAAEELEDDRFLLSAHGQAAITAVVEGRREEARAHGELAVQAARRAGSSSGSNLGFALLALGLALDAQRHHDDAFSAFREAVDVTEIGELWTADEALAGHYVRREQFAEAAARYGALLIHFRSLGHPGKTAELLRQVAQLFVKTGREREAIKVRTVLAHQKPSAYDVDEPFFAATIEEARQRLTPDEQAATTLEGSMMTFDALADFVIEQLEEVAQAAPES